MKILKKFYSIILIFHLGLTIGLLFFLPACTLTWVNQITNIYDIIWYSKNPVIEILILNENQGYGFGYFKDNEIKTEIYLRWGNARFDFVAADKYNALLTNSEFNINGSYKLLNNSQAELIIYQDNLFHKYTDNTIILNRKKINQNNVDAIYRINVCWKSISPNLTFKVLPTERRRGKGILEYENTLYNIIFYWEEDSRFSVYELQSDLQSESRILSGTYTSSNLKATLTIEDDLIFNHKFKTIELVAKGLNDP